MSDAGTVWPYKGDFVFLVNPMKKAKLIRVRNGAIGLLVGIALCSILTGRGGPVQTWEIHRENVRLRPVMERAMRAGSAEAGTWLGVHFRKEYPGLLEDEAARGEPEAMFDVGLLDLARGDAKGRALIHAAAEHGNEHAVRYELNRGDNGLR